MLKREQCVSDFGIRRLTEDEKDLQAKFLKDNKMKMIVPKQRANEKISRKYEKVVI